MTGKEHRKGCGPIYSRRSKFRRSKSKFDFWDLLGMSWVGMKEHCFGEKLLMEQFCQIVGAPGFLCALQLSCCHFQKSCRVPPRLVTNLFNEPPCPQIVLRLLCQSHEAVKNSQECSLMPYTPQSLTCSLGIVERVLNLGMGWNEDSNRYAHNIRYTIYT